MLAAECTVAHKYDDHQKERQVPSGPSGRTSLNTCTTKKRYSHRLANLITKYTRGGYGEPRDADRE